MRHTEAGVSENRKFERVVSRLRCWCEGQDITVYARIGNLSEGGIFVRTSTPMERGSKATLRFGTEGVEAPAVVVWSRNEGHGGPPGMGLAFEELQDGVRDAIRRLIEEDRSPSKAQISN